MVRPSTANDLAVEFVTLNNRLRTGDERSASMRRLVDMAVELIPGCDWAGITSWPVDREPRTATHTGEVAAVVDQLQYRLDGGPCMTAATEGGPIHVPDLAAELRWPNFCAVTLARTPVRAVLSFHLGDEPLRSALNLYAGRPGAFDADALSAGTLFATHARVLVLHAESADKVANLSVALNTSRQIGIAIGILMSAHRVSNDEAFDMLRTASRQLNRKLRDVADDVTHTGTLPETR